MAKGDENVSEVGLSNLAHAIRRSTALKVAMEVTPPGSSIEEMLGIADRLALWIGGKAAQVEAEQRLQPEGSQSGSLGVPFGQRDEV